MEDNLLRPEHRATVRVGARLGDGVRFPTGRTERLAWLGALLAALALAVLAAAGEPDIALLGAIALVAGATALRNPLLYAPLVGLLLPAGGLIELPHIEVSPLEAALGGGAVGYVVRVALRPTERRLEPLHWAFVALLGGIAISIAGPGTRSTQVRDLLTWTALGLLFHAVTTHLHGYRARRYLLCAVAAAAALEAVVALYEYVDRWSERFSLRDGAIVYPLPRGTLEHPNALAQFLVLSCFLVLALTFAERGLLRRLAFATAGLTAVALVVTFSRASWIALAAGAAVYLLEPRARRPLLAGGAAIAAAGAALAVAGGGAIGARIESLFTSSVSGLADFRIELAERAARIAGDNPLTGAGRFEEVGIYAGREDLATHPHNLFLGLAVFFGIPAALAFAAVVVLAARAARRGLAATGARRTAAVAALALLTAMLVNGLFEYPFWNVTLATVVVLGLGVVAVADRAPATALPGPTPRLGQRAAPSALAAAQRSAASWRWAIAPAVLWIALGAVHVWWLARFRRGFPLDIDESGYVWFSFQLHDALRADSLLGLWREFQHEGWAPPLLPAVTAFVQLAGGAGDVVLAMGVQLLFLGVLIFASYGIGHRLGGHRAGLLTALVVSTIPAVTDFTRTYHMVISSTAAYAAATYALLASDRLRHRGWTVAWGVALGLTLLSRTMMLAFAPALLVAAAWVVVVDRAVRARLLNVALGVAAFVGTTLLWYATSWRPITSYLRSAGYGDASGQYGAEHSLFSTSWWTQELTGAVNGSLYVPLAAVLLAALAAAAVGAVRNARWSDGPGGVVRAWVSRAVRSEAIVPLLVVVQGYLALSSSPNQGTGFPVPLLPSLVALTVVAALRLPWRGVATAFAAAFVVVAVANVVTKADVVSPASKVRTVVLPVLGGATIADGRGYLHQNLENAGVQLGGPTAWLADRERGWMTLDERVATALEGIPESEQRVRVVPQETLLNASALRLGAYRAGYPAATFDYVDTGGRDTVAAYRNLLESSDPGLLVTTDRAGLQFGPTVTSERVEDAARSLGFRRVSTLPVPDGRAVHVWRADPNGR